MTHSQLDAMLAESGLAPEEATELADLLAPLTELGGEAPAPSDELLRIFGGDTPGTSSHEPGPLGRRHRSRGTLAGVVVLALSGVGATGLSAAANTLPSALQHQVAGFSRHFLPFDFPEPPTRKPRHSLSLPDAGPAQPRAAEGRGTRLEAAIDATRSSPRSPYMGAATQVGPAGSGPKTRDERKGTTSATTGSHASAAGGSGGDSSQETHEIRSSEQAPWPTHNAEQDEPGSKDRERDPQKDRERSRETVKDDDKHDGSTKDKDEYDGLSDRPVRGGGLGNPKDPHSDPQKGKPIVGGDQGGAAKDRSGDKSGEHDDPSDSAGDERPGERSPSDQVGDGLSRLPQVAQELLRGDAPRT